MARSLACGSKEAASSRWARGWIPRPGDEVIDAGGMALVPGLVNGHTHAAMTLFRGHGGDLPLMEWLEEVIWPVEARLDADDVYWGARLACVEMIRTGTVRFWDMYWHAGATARAVEDAGLRATIGAPLIDVGAAAGEDELREGAERSLEQIGAARELIAPALAPHADLHGLRAVAALDRRGGAERELPVHIHLSETEDEVPRCVEAHGARPAEYLDRLGLLGPRTLLAHGVWLDEAELELIAARGATVVTNPVANLKLAVGRAFPYLAAREAGVHGRPRHRWAGSNDSLDLFADMKIFALLHKHAGGRSRRGERRRGLGDRHRRVARRCSGRQPRPGRAGRLPAAARGLAPAEPRRLHGGPRLRGLGSGRRHDGRQRPGPDARRRGRGRGRDRSPAPASAPAAWDSGSTLGRPGPSPLPVLSTAGVLVGAERG